MSQRANHNNHRRQPVRKNRSIVNTETIKSVTSHPPPYMAQSSRKITIRYLATGNISSNFTYSALAGMLGLMGTSTTTSVFLTQVFRVNKIRVWSPVATAGTPVNAAITWSETSADFQSPPVTKSDTSISFDHPAFVSMKPPRGSLASKWHGVGQTDVMFILDCPVGSTVDIMFEFVLNDVGPPVPGPTLVAGTLGTLYHKIVNNLTAVFPLNSI